MAAPKAPDPPREQYNPRSLKYELNGQGQSWRPTPFEEATGPDGKRFVRKIGTDIVYEIVKNFQETYVCITCDNPTDYLMTSRTVRRDLGSENHIRCEPHRYCPTCEKKPEKRELEAIDENELFKH